MPVERGWVDALKRVNGHVKTLIPVRIERLLNHSGRFRLLTTDRGDGERVREFF
jgi:hypothetical protein